MAGLAALALAGGAAVGLATPAAEAAPSAASPSTSPRAHITRDASAKTLTLSDGAFRMVFGYGGRAVVTSFAQGGKELLNAGAYSTAQLGGTGATLDSRHLDADPVVAVKGQTATARFTMADSSVAITETWTFDLAASGIALHIDRSYDWAAGADTTVTHNGLLDIGWARVWDNIRRPDDGGNMPIGNAYTGADGFFLSQPNDRYGVEESNFVYLSNASKTGLAVAETAGSGTHLATEFAYTGDGNTYQQTQTTSAPTWSYTAGTSESGLVYGGHSSNGTTNYIYSPVTTTPDETDSVTYTFRDADYASYYSLGGTIKGVSDQDALSSLINDFGRSGVIDKGYGMSTVGLRYPGVGPYDMVYADRTVLGSYDPAMVESQKNLLTWFSQTAQASTGHMDGRTFHLDHPWNDNNLADSDPAYALSVSNMYQASADSAWLGSLRDSVEKSLGYVLDTKATGDGMYSNDILTCTGTKSIREWNDALYIKYEDAYVNELTYGALDQWSGLEKTVFHDEAKSAAYATAAAKLKAQFNLDNTAGGLWNPTTKSFDWWRCPDGSTYGDVVQTQVNLQAIIYGLVDQSRARQILDTVDTQMQTNHLGMIPENFYPLITTTEDWTGDHFQTGIEDGAIYPLMTEEYMRAAALVGERSRSLTYLKNTLAAYEKSGFNNMSYTDWFGNLKGGEAWFPSNANGATGLFSDVLGIQPTANGVTIAPNIPSSMNGTSVTRTVRAGSSVTVTYHSELSQTVKSTGAKLPVTLQWSGQKAGSRYVVLDGLVPHVVTADSFGTARYTYPGGGTHLVTLLLGSAAGYVLPAAPATDLALGKTATASSSLEDGSYSLKSVTDGDRFSTDYAWGWSSDSDLTENHTEQLTIDLGTASKVGTVQLLPRDYDNKDTGKGFPVDFSIQVSTDGSTWKTVTSQTAYPQPTEAATPTFTFAPTSARYVRVVGTNLRSTDGGYRMQLAEVEVSR